MCVGALLESDVAALVFAVPNPVDGAAGSVLQLAQHPGLARRLQVVSGIRAEEAAELTADRGPSPPEPDRTLWYPLRRRGVRVVDGAALEKRSSESSVGSNPTLSATPTSTTTRRDCRRVCIVSGGEVA